MKPETKAERAWRHIQTCFYLKPRGFVPLGNFLFSKNGITYDLSAADLEQIERIEKEGLFVVEAEHEPE